MHKTTVLTIRDILKVNFSLLIYYFCIQITNQIVNACKEYIQRDTFSLNQEDILWKVLFEEIRSKVNSSEGQPGKTRASRRKDNKDVSEDESLFGKLKACVQLYVSFDY